MKVMHLATGYSYSGLYRHLFNKMSDYKIIQDVYVPLHPTMKETSMLNENKFNIQSSKIIRRYDKIIYYTKILRITSDVETKYDVSNYEIIHAHSLFSDGGVALQLYLKYGIPYVVAVRDTDINKYYKYAHHLKGYVKEILKNAAKVVFISQAYKKKLIAKYQNSKDLNLAEKSVVIPNGINDFWHIERQHKRETNGIIKILFVGNITKRKNLITVINALTELNKDKTRATLQIVGDGDLMLKYNKKYHRNANIEFVGKINTLKGLEDIYIKNDVLVVPSITETFGLVYPEAMSCGTPVIYSKGQGFDETFKEGEVGYSVNAKDHKDVVNRIMLIMKNYTEISKNCIENAKIFNWDSIVKKYIKLYEDVN